MTKYSVQRYYGSELVDTFAFDNLGDAEDFIFEAKKNDDVRDPCDYGIEEEMIEEEMIEEKNTVIYTEDGVRVSVSDYDESNIWLHISNAGFTSGITMSHADARALINGLQKLFPQEVVA
jgi:hypothetical protein